MIIDDLGFVLILDSQEPHHLSGRHGEPPGSCVQGGVPWARAAPRRAGWLRPPDWGDSGCLLRSGQQVRGNRTGRGRPSSRSPEEYTSFFPLPEPAGSVDWTPS